MESSVSLLKNVFAAASAVGDECVVHPTDTGYTVSCMSPSSVTMFGAEVYCDGSPVGEDTAVQVKDVLDMLRSAGPVCDFRTENGMLRIESDGLVQRRSVLDLAHVQYRPIKELPLESGFASDPGRISRFAKAAREDDFCMVKVGPEGVTIGSVRPDTGAVSAELSLGTESSPTGEAMAGYPLQDFLDIVNRVPKDTDVRFRLETDYPMEVSCSTSDFILRWLIAPRIEGE